MPVTASGSTESLDVVPGQFLVKGPVSGQEGIEVIDQIGDWTLVRARGASSDADSAALGLSRALDTDVVPNYIYHLAADDLLAEQWALNNTGQTGGTADADIDAPEAWGVTVGDSSVVVAVIDSGVDLDHPDLLDQLIPGENFIDEGQPPEDVLGHGTAVASVIAAAENEVGIVGVAPSVTVMPIKACTEDANIGCPTSALISAVQHANNAGVDIINLSLGGGAFSQPLFDAVAASQALVVAAAGNARSNNDQTPFYPASFDLPNVVSVASTDYNDDLSLFSNFGGATVHIGAPGENILMATVDGWAFGHGTSFAAPHVAGVAALMKSEDPSLEAEETMELLMASTDAKASLAGMTISGGRLNAHKALVGPYRPTARVEIRPEQPTADQVNFTGASSTDPDGTITSYQWSFSDGTTPTGATVIKSMVGVDYLSGSLTVTDNDGGSSTAIFEIDFNARPVAALTANPMLAMAPVAVTLDARRSFDPEGSELTYTWDFSNGITATGDNPTRLFTEGGIHQVTVTAEDVDGLTDTASVELLIGLDFADMDSSTFVLDVAWASALGVTRGCNPPVNDRYCPNDPVTRGQMAAFLTRALNLPAAPNIFIDDNGSTFEADIGALAAAGITKGCNPPTNNRYCPNDPVTRGQMAAFLHRGLAPRLD